MSILIKGMEMPESCYYCPFADGVWQKNKRCLINGKEMPRDGRDVQQNHINCPLIEIPPHGRLIDADAMAELWKGCKIEGSIKPLLDTRPTIIPAEEGET